MSNLLIMLNAASSPTFSKFCAARPFKFQQLTENLQLELVLLVPGFNFHSVKIVKMRSFSESVFSCIQTGKCRPGKTPYQDTFIAAFVSCAVNNNNKVKIGTVTVVFFKVSEFFGVSNIAQYVKNNFYAPLHNLNRHQYELIFSQMKLE